MLYGADHAEVYDPVFRSRGKDFADEAEQLVTLIRHWSPGARSLLDVACGTGAHLATLEEFFDPVAGVEYSPDMLAVARRRLPGRSLHAGDMRDFDLGRTFDAVTCMGNSVACMATEAELQAAVGRMAAHLNPGGVLVVEPWWFPDNFIDGHVGGHTMHEDGRVVSRVTHSREVDGRTRHEVRFTVADGNGIRDFSEVLMQTLFTREQYADAFRGAGCTVELINGFQLATGRPNSPGLFIGSRS
ncbi:class I SAM-dependent methyltransferase [Actinoplanes sp. NPDC049802]|uniref:class I SAM-dependent DNA methyltransferase n=1 Tax=Actinoplanes sp. NPDC049802 TaxID=3154742 RepID=UPI0033F46F80